MKTLILAALLALAAPRLWAQTALDEIEANNTTLRALRMQMEADKAEGRATLAPEGLEVELGYLWGTPAPALNRKDVSVSQSIDMGTLTGRRRKVVRRQADVAEQEYRRARQEILLEAQQAMIQLSCADTLLALQQRRLAEARTQSEAWKKRLEGGAAIAIDVNKIELTLTLLEGEVQQAQIECDTWRGELVRLNGGLSLAAPAAVQALPDVLPSSFEAWFDEVSASCPAMQAAAAQVQLADEQVRLARTENMPGVSVGYMSEMLKGDSFHGVTMGLTLPLWGSRSRMQAARAAREAAEAGKQDAAVQLAHSLRRQYDRTAALLRMAQTYERSALQHDNQPLLLRALESGSLTLTDYLTELALCHEAMQRVIEAWRDYRLALAQLQAVTL